jgi:hypothetical protein
VMKLLHIWKCTDFWCIIHRALKLTMLSFRLNDLPQELRNSICEYALEPRVIFRHTSLTDIRPTYHLPNLDHHPRTEHAKSASLMLTLL